MYINMNMQYTELPHYRFITVAIKFTMKQIKTRYLTMKIFTRFCSFHHAEIEPFLGQNAKLQ